MANPRVFHIPASAPFLPTLIAALAEGRVIPGFPAAHDPLALAAATFYLPTRRACRLARDIFLDVLGGDALILPRIAAIGDVDEDEIAFAQAGEERESADDFSAAALDLPPALDAFERRMLLAQLVAKWAAAPELHGAAGAPLIATSPAAALALADDLARLMDDMTTRQVAWEKLDGLVPGDLDHYWQLTLRFLKIAREAWPALLQERGVIEPAARRDLLIAEETKRLAISGGPVIAAGSTGSMPATAKLLAAIAHLPHGAVVLPGLDTDLDEASWELIGGNRETTPHDGAPAAGHPQFAMQALLKRIGIARSAVIALAPAALHGRELIVSESLRPAASTERWFARLAQPAFAAQAGRAMDSLAVVEAANAEEEALAIAVALRESHETPGTSAALVTPDRALARRVVANLARWNVPVDNSGGDALGDTSAAVFARLAAEAALDGLPPVTLLALLKHPLLRLGGNAGDHAASIAALERAILRGPRPRPGSAGLAHALATFGQMRGTLHPRDPRSSVGDAALEAANNLAAKLAKALAPLEHCPQGERNFAALARRHGETIAALSGDAAGKVAAVSGNDGKMLGETLEQLATSEAAAGFIVAPADYPELLRAVIASRVVRWPEATGVRVRIFGPLESRLQHIDRVVLSGLAEGIWPPETRTDPWLSRPMRQQLGLDLPERRIGLSAHDFAQALGAREVILTRAAKISGAPTVMSRFVQRLAAVTGEARWTAACASGERYLELARALDRPAKVEPVKQPAPKPPRAARPTALSVTAIEDWLRDPYTIYARYILKLAPLDAVDTPPGARDRGSVIHGAIGEFTQSFAAQLPADALGELLKLGRKHFAPLDDYPEARAFWWPRFARIAGWFAGWERERRAQIETLYAEIRGEIAIKLGGREFKLSAIADRIERRSDGSYAILDYKTGAPRTEKQVRTGLAPQLTLEAAILRGGGFKTIPAGGTVSQLVYVTLKGGEPPGVAREIDFKDSTPDTQADAALTRLTGVIARFENENEAYTSLVHPMWKTHYGDFDHLARVKEWSATGGASDDGGGE